MSPRKYQFEPTSVIGPASPGNEIGGGAAPNRSAASEGVAASAMPARAAAIAFIGSFPIEAKSAGARPAEAPRRNLAEIR